MYDQGKGRALQQPEMEAGRYAPAAAALAKTERGLDETILMSPSERWPYNGCLPHGQRGDRSTPMLCDERVRRTGTSRAVLHPVGMHNRLLRYES